MFALRRTEGAPGLSLARGLDSLFDGLLDGYGTPTAWAPPVNIYEDAEAYLVEAELPGFALEQVELELDGGELTLAGRRALPAPANATAHRQERAVGEFRRTFTLPVAIRSDGVKATLQEGVLRVTLPKSETAKTRKVQITRE